MEQTKTATTESLLTDRHSELVESPKRVRVVLGGAVIADSRRVLLLRGKGKPPVYCFPQSDIRDDVLAPAASLEQRSNSEPNAVARWHVTAGGMRRENGAWSYPEGQSLDHHVAFDWEAMDAWFEEDEEVFVHPRDPFTRVEILPGSQRVKLVQDGITIAESRRPLLLFETGLPTRYYLPKMDVRMDLLLPSETVTRCPYKGQAGYYSLGSDRQPIEDLFWSYRYPTVEASRVAGLLSFFPERIDQVTIDDRLLTA